MPERVAAVCIINVCCVRQIDLRVFVGNFNHLLIPVTQKAEHFVMPWHTEYVFPFASLTIHFRSRDSSVGIATRYGLDGPGIESR